MPYTVLSLLSATIDAAPVVGGIALIDIVIFLLLLAASAFFSCTESALTAVNPVRVQSLVTDGSRRAMMVQRLLKDRTRLISALLIGNNIVNVILATFATTVFQDAFATTLDAGEAAAFAAVVSIVFLLVMGEVLPKTIAVNLPLGISLTLAYPVYAVRLVLTPLTVLLAGMQRVMLKLVGHDPDAAQAVTGDDLKTLARMADSQDVLGVGSGDAIQRLVDLHETSIREVMTPRTDIVAIPVTADFAAVLAVFREHLFSRVPVYTTDLDDIVGVVNFRDLIGMTDGERASFKVDALLRQPIFVPEQKRVDAMISEMRRTRVHFAVVVDEYGGTAGIVTLENLLEEVVGQIEDEYDDEAVRLRVVRSGVVLADGRSTVGEVETALGVDIGPADDVDTLAGLFLREFGKIPVEGDSISLNDVEISINAMRGARIRRLLVRRITGMTQRIERPANEENKES